MWSLFLIEHLRILVHGKACCYKRTLQRHVLLWDLTMCSKNVDIILGSTVNIIGKAYVIV